LTPDEEYSDLVAQIVAQPIPLNYKNGGIEPKMAFVYMVQIH